MYLQAQRKWHCMPKDSFMHKKDYGRWRDLEEQLKVD